MHAGSYIIASNDNPFHINVRNILGPAGYSFLNRCTDAVGLIRSIRQSAPDFFIADNTISQRELKIIIETVEEEMLCACIITSEIRNTEVEELIRDSAVVSYVRKPISPEVLISVVEMTCLNFYRIRELNKKIRKMNDTLEARNAVDKAKRLLMKKMNISEEEAYRIIRTRSMNSRAPIKDIAEAILMVNDIKVN